MMDMASRRKDIITKHPKTALKLAKMLICFSTVLSMDSVTAISDLIREEHASSLLDGVETYIRFGKQTYRLSILQREFRSENSNTEFLTLYVTLLVLSHHLYYKNTLES